MFSLELFMSFDLWQFAFNKILVLVLCVPSLSVFCFVWLDLKWYYYEVDGICILYIVHAKSWLAPIETLPNTFFHFFVLFYFLFLFLLWIVISYWDGCMAVNGICRNLLFAFIQSFLISVHLEMRHAENNKISCQKSEKVWAKQNWTEPIYMNMWEFFSR